MSDRLPVDDLAQEIRRVDGNHDLGAGALAEKLMPFLGEIIEDAWSNGYRDGRLDEEMYQNSLL